MCVGMGALWRMRCGVGQGADVTKQSEREQAISGFPCRCAGIAEGTGRITTRVASIEGWGYWMGLGA